VDVRSTKAAARPLRTGARRASSPAGAPASASAAPALLVFGADGKLVPAPGAASAAPVKDDAETHLAGPPARAAVGSAGGAGGSVEKGPHDEPASETEAQAEPAASAQPDAEPDAQPDAEPETPAEPAAGPAPSREPDEREPDEGVGSVKAADAEPAPAPLTRRARRLAEDVSPEAAAVPPPTETDKAPAAPPARAATALKRRKGGWAWARGLLFLVLIGAMVLGLGTVVPADDADGGASATEAARDASWTQTQLLLSLARSARDAEKDAATKTWLAHGAAALELQLAALAGSHAATAQAAPTAPAATTAGFAQALAGSANTLLADSLTADGALGRTFAAAGVNRLLLAAALDSRLGKPAPPSPYLPAALQPVPDPSASCKSTRAPQAGTSADAALTAAARAEQKAAYAYQVAGSRLAEPGLSRAVELAAVHENNLGLLNAELARRCLPVAAAVPGFVLAREFTEAPEAALAKLEGELALVYGDLASLSPPDKESPGAPATAKPGAAQAVAARLPGLREMAVAGLVGSASRQQEWGGGLDPLPGIANTAVPAPAGTAPTVTGSVPAMP